MELWIRMMGLEVGLGVVRGAMVVRFSVVVLGTTGMVSSRHVHFVRGIMGCGHAKHFKHWVLKLGGRLQKKSIYVFGV
jgi:hypothetical protein